MKSISFLRLNCELTFCSRNSLTITLMRNEFTILRIFYELTIYFANLPSISEIDHQSTIFLANPSFTAYSRIYDAYTINFANKLWNKFRFREFTVYSAELPWMNNLSQDNTLNSLFVSQFHYISTIYFANQLWIHCLFREFTMNPPSISRLN